MEVGEVGDEGEEEVVEEEEEEELSRVTDSWAARWGVERGWGGG